MRIADYQPNYYENVKEFKLLANIEDELFEEINNELQTAHANNYVMTANEKAIRIYEDALNIIPNPAIETLEFRRERILNRFQLHSPFTLRFLKEKLDAIIGKGKYVLTLDYNAYTMYLEMTIDNASWFKEANLTINWIKPANIKYVMVPVVFERLGLKERLFARKVEYFRISKSLLGVNRLVEQGVKDRFKLNEGKIGETPFITFAYKDQFKLNEGKVSVTPLATLEDGYEVEVPIR